MPGSVERIERDATPWEFVLVWTWFRSGKQPERSSAPRRHIGTFVVTVVAALGVSLALDIVRPAALSYPTTEAALETCLLLAAIAGAWALSGDAAQTRRPRELLLSSGLVMLVLVDLVSLQGPTVLLLRSATAVAGAPAIGAVFAAAVFLAAALTPAERVLGTRRPWLLIALGGWPALLRVRDDGTGPNAPAPHQDGFGMTSMRERAIDLGGRLEIRPREERGTELEVVMS
jgi:hypothetical protein